MKTSKLLSTRSIFNSFVLTLGTGLSLTWFLTPPTQAAYNSVGAAQIVRQGYCQILKRPAQDADLTNWGSQLKGNMTAKGFVYALVDSAKSQCISRRSSSGRTIR
ncbi:hypothetical protein [Leptolyngbya sp. FACHB-17]|uniref:hypothetical protein n=1 Tax=unclassified Leptolyngbya TaxID=2650499 RepID=UPI00168013B2|nr:hypothetical protein [Leptolyngbya sp. FACHB-17]MBD2078671.1 hypothetical protein [Leptolyngbya sp. FACHB-17]